jgi:hypothetical protein
MTTIGGQDEAFYALATRLLPSIIQEFEEEADQPIQTVIRFMRDNKEVNRVDLPAVLEQGKAGKAEIRIVIKAPLTPGRFSFSAQAIFNGVAEGTGLSGFAIRGKITLDEPVSPFRLTARSNRYNVWLWEEPFRTAEEVME